MKSKEVQSIPRETQLRIDEFERSYWRTTGKKMLKDWRLYLMIVPLILIFLFWRYFPMYELTAAFKQYDRNLDISEMNYVGLYWFEQLFFGTAKEEFWPAFRNTFLLSFYGLLFGFPMPILLALFFSEIKSDIVRSAMQICTYLSKFVSMVVITSLIQLLLRKGNATAQTQPGVLARFLLAIGALKDVDVNEIGLLYGPQYFRSIYQISGVWAEAGYGSIVYFAAIIGISPTSYEAARIDGASKMQQIKTVVLPGILSTVIIMLITRLGHLMTVGYEKVLLLKTAPTTGQGNESTAEVIATWVFKLGGMDGGGGGDESLGSAADMVNAVISMLLVTGANMISKRASNTSLYQGERKWLKLKIKTVRLSLLRKR